MSIQTVPLLVAKATGDKLAFTQPMPFEELYKLVNERCPVQKIYLVSEGPGGYTYREVGEFRLTFSSPAVPDEAPPGSPSLVDLPVKAPIEPKVELSPTPLASEPPKPKKPRKSNPRPSEPELVSKSSIQIDGFIPAQPSQDTSAFSHLKGDWTSD